MWLLQWGGELSPYYLLHVRKKAERRGRSSVCASPSVQKLRGIYKASESSMVHIQGCYAKSLILSHLLGRLIPSHNTFVINLQKKVKIFPKIDLSSQLYLWILWHFLLLKFATRLTTYLTKEIVLKNPLIAKVSACGVLWKWTFLCTNYDKKEWHLPLHKPNKDKSILHLWFKSLK